MKTSLTCLAIAVVMRLLFEGLLAQTVEVPRVWMKIWDTSHEKAQSTDISSDASYTSIVSEYKPVVRKLPYGKWEVTFVSEIAQDIP